MIPGLTSVWDNIRDAVGSAAGAVGDAVGNVIAPLWKDPHVNQNIPPAIIDEPQVSDEPITTQPDPSASSDLSAPAVPEPASIETKVRPKHSLGQEFHLLQMEAMSTCEGKAKEAYSKLQQTHKQNQTMTKLLQLITTQSEHDGTFTVKDAEAKKLLREAREYDKTVVPEKSSYTKDERDDLVRAIELKNRNLDTSIKLLVNETQECMQTRNTFYQELKTCWDKIYKAVEKFIQGIQSR